MSVCFAIIHDLLPFSRTKIALNKIQWPVNKTLLKNKYRSYQDFSNIHRNSKINMVLPEIVLFLACLLSVNCIMWNQEPNTKKCLREELQQNIPVIGEFEVSEAPGQTVDYVVTDSKGHILAKRQAISKGKLSFNTESYDTYEICFTSQVPNNQRGIAQEISLVTKHGVETKNYDALGDAAQLKPMEKELKRLEDLSNEIVHDFSMMRKREEEMRNTNESTNVRVFYFSLFTMACLVGLAVWQVLYLRTYFKSKKLIE